MCFARILTAVVLILSGALCLSIPAQEAVPPRGGEGGIKIITDPPRAVAYMGGVKLGFTPVDTAFESGRHTLTLLLNGEELVRMRVNVWPDSVTVVEKKLVLPYGSLTLTTNPAGCDCKVFVDGEEVGATRGGPLNINNLRAGTHVIRVSTGSKVREREVVIRPEEKTELLVNFAGD